MNEEEKLSCKEKRLWPSCRGGRGRPHWGSRMGSGRPDQWARAGWQAGEAGVGQEIRLFPLRFILGTVEGGRVT